MGFNSVACLIDKMLLLVHFTKFLNESQLRKFLLVIWRCSPCHFSPHPTPINIRVSPLEKPFVLYLPFQTSYMQQIWSSHLLEFETFVTLKPTVPSHCHQTHTSSGPPTLFSQADISVSENRIGTPKKVCQSAVGDVCYYPGSGGQNEIYPAQAATCSYNLIPPSTPTADSESGLRVLSPNSQKIDRSFISSMYLPQMVHCLYIFFI